MIIKTPNEYTLNLELFIRSVSLSVGFDLTLWYLTTYYDEGVLGLQIGPFYVLGVNHGKVMTDFISFTGDIRLGTKDKEYY